ncbi:hypothetical protein DY000_02045359 [Brassica cretica]|uniref:Uncharacterized protein n=1 Tax=Brassica cretica TaxID=69181 RepID=A0ABQ7EVA6_BRACR|nr:hypothetical protein DY000_02045359 [Brassica cretica]
MEGLVKKVKAVVGGWGMESSESHGSECGEAITPTVLKGLAWIRPFRSFQIQ